MTVRRFLLLFPALAAWLGGWYPASAEDDVASALEKRVFTDSAGKTLSYRLMMPQDYDPARTYPLVLFLHGAGERGTDNEAQLKLGVPEFVKRREQYPCFLVVPQCPPGDRWADFRRGADQPAPPAEPSEPMRLTLELLDSLRKEFSIDPKRIYVTGLSMGGFGTWDILSRRPDLFARAAPICGGGDEANAEKIASTPLWVFHGARDPLVPVSRSREMVQALQKAGGSPKYTEYPDVGHDAWVPTYSNPEFFHWMFDDDPDL